MKATYTHLFDETGVYQWKCPGPCKGLIMVATFEPCNDVLLEFIRTRPIKCDHCQKLNQQISLFGG